MTLILFYLISVATIICAGMATLGMFQDIKIFEVPVLGGLSIALLITQWFYMMSLMRGQNQSNNGGENV